MPLSDEDGIPLAIVPILPLSSVSAADLLIIFLEVKVVLNSLVTSLTVKAVTSWMGFGLVVEMK